MLQPTDFDRFNALELLAERCVIILQIAHRERGLTPEEIYIMQHANEVTGGKYGKKEESRTT